MKNENVDIAGNEKAQALTAAEKIDALVMLLLEKKKIDVTPADYAGALETFHGDLESAKVARKTSLETAIAATTAKLQSNIRRVVLGVVFVALIAALLSSGLLVIFEPALDPATMPVNSSSLLTLLGFVVALAAYLATLARTLKDKITALKEKAKIDAAQIAAHAENLMRVIRAEALLVTVGLLTTGRIVVGPLMNAKVLAFDYFLTLYMVFIILYLAYLHARQWTYSAIS
jgi:multisubunit Na+/H+ antiporter MnhF subunit